MEFIKDWIKNIVYFILFVKLITSLIPNGNMSKYIKLFSGILLMLVLVGPLISINQIDEKVLYHFFDFDKAIAHSNFTTQVNTYSNINDTLALNLYKRKVEAHINEIVEAEHAKVCFIEVLVNDEEGPHFGEIIGVNLTVTPINDKRSNRIEKVDINTKDANSDALTAEAIILQKNIKIALHGFYNIPADNMNISIE